MTMGPTSDVDGRGTVWWLHPAVLLLGLPGLTLALSIMFSDQDYRRLWGTPRVLEPSLVALMATGLLACIAGVLVAQVRAAGTVRAPAGGDVTTLLHRGAVVFLVLALLGNVFLLASAAASGMLTLEALTGQRGGEKVPTVPGVTTLTQFGIANVVVATYLLRTASLRTSRRRVLLGGIVALIVLSLVRAALNAERLATLEVVIPALVVLCLTSRPRSRERRVLSLAPLALVPGVFGIFALFEFGRSWQYYSTVRDVDFGTFIVERFAAYYVTAYNNSAIYLAHGPHPPVPYSLLEFVWQLPGVSQVGLYPLLTGVDPESEAYRLLLVHHGNPEFNNPGGVGLPFLDLGPVGGVLFFLVAGLVIGRLHARATSGMTATLSYPLLVLTIVELPRYLWICQGRAFPAAAGLLVLGLLADRVRRNTPAPFRAVAPREGVVA
ncbi:O-antigen polymerase [Propioniciclava soli]|uniref:O-antigen polymerase n=1 Tax=Propioniciclava soli TaxID=2775081 RepID=UPI001E3CB3D7|nr:O-antigen polymerase [Propioniciclava soli]